MADILVLSEPASVESLALVLELAGNHCSTAASLGAAVDILHQDSFDLVVMDFGLYKYNSGHVIKLLKGICPEISVLVITGERNGTDGAEVLNLSGKTPADLFHRVENVLGHSDGILLGKRHSNESI